MNNFNLLCVFITDLMRDRSLVTAGDHLVSEFRWQNRDQWESFGIRDTEKLIDASGQVDEREEDFYRN